jgi:AcrR family transcriptional regulator
MVWVLVCEEPVMEMSRSKKAWLTAGLGLLETGGPPRLTIDEMTVRMNRTKGSFYHHFRSREGFIAELLRFWESEMTLKTIAVAEAADSLAEKRRQLTSLTMDLHESRLELHLRAWSLSDPMVREAVARVDGMRQDYLARIAGELTGSAALGREIARAVYAVFVGAQQMIPPVRGEELLKIYGMMNRLYDLNS